MGLQDDLQEFDELFEHAAEARVGQTHSGCPFIVITVGPSLAYGPAASGHEAVEIPRSEASYFATSGLQS